MKGEFKTGFAVGLGVIVAVTVAGVILNYVGPMIGGSRNG